MRYDIFCFMYIDGACGAYGEPAHVSADGQSYTCCENLVAKEENGIIICRSDCEPWCEQNEASPEIKCDWILCSGCSVCNEQGEGEGDDDACGEYGQPAHLSADAETYSCCHDLILKEENGVWMCRTDCEPWCVADEAAWDIKCDWTGCGGCGDCSTASGDQITSDYII